MLAPMRPACVVPYCNLNFPEFPDDNPDADDYVNETQTEESQESEGEEEAEGTEDVRKIKVMKRKAKGSAKRKAKVRFV